MLTDPCIHLSSLRIDYILCSLAHAFLYHMFLDYLSCPFVSILHLSPQVDCTCSHKLLTIVSLCCLFVSFCIRKKHWWKKVQNELVMLRFGMQLVVFNSKMQFNFLANATKSHNNLVLNFSIFLILELSFFSSSYYGPPWQIPGFVLDYEYPSRL